MEPERDWKYADYLLSDGQRRALFEDPSLGQKETNKAEEIRERAENLDLRIQYLFEDIELLYRAGVLEELDLRNLKADLEEIDPLIEHRYDSAMIKHELENPDGVKVSSFGLALGHILSQIYSGDSTELMRLWWGLVLGYFGHPTRAVSRPYPHSNTSITEIPPSGFEGESPSDGLDASDLTTGLDEPSQTILFNIYRKFTETARSNISNLQMANFAARRMLAMFGQRLSYELADSEDIGDVGDFPRDIQALIVAAAWGSVNEQTLTDVFHRYYSESYKREPGERIAPIEEFFSEETDTAVEILTSLYVELELLEEINDLCNQIVNDRELIENHEGRGVAAVDVFELLWDADEPKYANEVNSAIQKGTNNVKWMLNEFADRGENRSNKEWNRCPPAVSTAEGFELTQYGELLGYFCFESDQPRTELYALAFSEEIRVAFDIDERVPVLVNELVESDVSTVDST